MKTSANYIEVRKAWRFRWIELINRFSNLEYLGKLWSGKLAPQWSGFGEDCCQYFDDLVLDDNYQDQLRDSFVSQSEYESIQSFHLAFRFYSDSHDNYTSNEEILSDPDWKLVVDTAFQGWQRLKQVLTDPDERVFAEELEKSRL